ncbi:flagellar basal body P-ring formation chaperone FlgA [Kineobactrum sediminis]|uniref:flagellar basal body P-ring formation chaperone FlgA n=1 Tax=Kineobactrum sediminis TaxID=1905677 RepID=UPI00139007D1|nr:flagellar basal body P-ring formation chaperone FlgA [Kineobactrum sediminis]
MKKYLAIAALAGLLSVPSASATEARQSLDAIRTAAEQFVLNRLGSTASGASATAGQLDSRLRLARCEQPLQAFAVAGDRLGGNTSVGVRCPGSWKLYVPVKVEVLLRVLALKRPLERGSILTEADLGHVLVDTRRLAQGYFTSIAAVSGHTVKRSAASGTILTNALIEESAVISRGQRVSLSASGTGIAVQAPGQALADARMGERVRVKNLSSGKVVEGIVRGPGNVEVQ